MYGIIWLIYSWCLVLKCANNLRWYCRNDCDNEWLPRVISGGEDMFQECSRSFQVIPFWGSHKKCFHCSVEKLSETEAGTDPMPFRQLRAWHKPPPLDHMLANLHLGAHFKTSVNGDNTGINEYKQNIQMSKYFQLFVSSHQWPNGSDENAVWPHLLSCSQYISRPFA